LPIAGQSAAGISKGSRPFRKKWQRFNKFREAASPRALDVLRVKVQEALQLEPKQREADALVPESRRSSSNQELNHLNSFNA
jgi:hypothetical protein